MDLLIWNKIKQSIKSQLPEHSYRMWIEPLNFEKMDTNGLILSCPNLFSKKRVFENYRDLIGAAIKEGTNQKINFNLIITDKKPPISEPYHSQLILPNMGKSAGRGSFLRKDFTFEEFVVGQNNGFAYSAALSLASKKDIQNNSLFLLSKTGMGKSHLSQAVGNHILSSNPLERLYYITAEDFTNEMVASFQNNSIGLFKKKYKSTCDVLLLEDVHYLTGKGRTQQELAMILDTLFNADKKIIFSSCYLPGDIPKLNDKLRSRLSCGLVSIIKAPDFKTRVRILKKKAKSCGYLIPDEVIEYLAGELIDDVRQLKNGLLQVVSKASLLGMPVDLNLAESIVKNIVRRKKQITIDLIKKLICKHYQITKNDLISRSRKKVIVKPRQIAIYLSRRYTDQSLQAIGKNFNRYHATAMHSIAAVEQSIKDKDTIQKQVEYFCKKLDTGQF